MKYCYECGRLTAGEPLFCNFCGRSYDVKLCPHKHPNPRSAEICSQCGSRDLSTPQPKVSGWWKVFAFVVRVGLAVLLVGASLALLLAIVQDLLTNPQLQGGFVGIAILLAVLWWMWSELPDWIRRAIRSVIKRKESGRER